MVPFSLQDYLIRRHIIAESFSNGVTKELIEILFKAQKQVQDHIRNQKAGKMTKTTMQKINVEINSALKFISEEYTNKLNKAQIEMIKDEYNKLKKTLRGNLGKSVKESNYILPVKRIQAILATPSGGRFVQDYIKAHVNSLRTRIRTQLTIDIIESSSMEKTARNLRTQFDISRRGANLISRTSIMDASNRANEEVFKENTDIIKGYRYVATLDNRTTLICAGLDGKEVRLRENLPQPPLHPLCRSLIAPILFDDQFEGLKRIAVTNVERKKVKHRDGTTSTKFRNVSGKDVSASTNFSKFLERQPAKWQREYLGKTRYELYKDGKLSLQEMATNSKSFTIEELKKKVS